MLNPLEQYLDQLARSLQGLPDEERQAEIHEVRHHLELLIAGRIENGESQEEATHAAIEQFGQSTLHGKDLKRAWRRGQGQALKKRAFVFVEQMRPALQVILTGGVVSLAPLTLSDALLFYLKWHAHLWLNAGNTGLSISLLYFVMGVVVAGIIWSKRLSALKSALFGALFYSIGMGTLNVGVYLFYLLSGGYYDFPDSFISSFDYFWEPTCLLAIAGAISGLLTGVILQRLSSSSRHPQTV